jgi:hypothetical protein
MFSELASYFLPHLRRDYLIETSVQDDYHHIDSADGTTQMSGCYKLPVLRHIPKARIPNSSTGNLNGASWPKREISLHLSVVELTALRQTNSRVSRLQSIAACFGPGAETMDG